MPFDLEQWQQKVRDWWTDQAPKRKTIPIDSAYALLAASAWLPFLATYADDPGPAMTALVGITAGVGSNLVANLVQSAYDRIRGGDQVTDQARQDTQTRTELDAILQATGALQAAQQALGDRWDDFARQLAGEIVALPGKSALTITLSDGSIVQGSVVAGDLTLDHGSTFVGGDYTHIQTQTVQISAPSAGQTTQARERALHIYLERLVHECNALQLRGMDPRAADVTRQETMSLAAVYTALDTNRRIPMSDDEFTTLQRPGDKPSVDINDNLPDERLERPMSALEAASHFDRLVLLGDPGAGKSTFVNHLTLRLAQAALAGNGIEPLPGWTRGAVIPVRVILRDLARSSSLAEDGTAASLWSFIESTLSESGLADVAPALTQRLDGRVMLLLDGLDEVETTARRRVLDAVTDFALTHRHTPILVTCRAYAYQEPSWRLSDFEQVTLAPFSEEQIEHFIRAWYAEVARMGLLPVSEAEERAARLNDAIRRPDLRVLAPNPLLLTMMALLHSSWGRLPEDHVQLYSEIVELLLARWEQSRLGREALTRARLSPRDLRFALEQVAYVAHSRQPQGESTADLAESFLRQILQQYLKGDWNRAGDVIRYIQERAGLLLERKPGVYTFPHRTVQEYLAGCHLSVQTDFPSRAADLVRDDEVRWREPFLLAVGKTARTENRVDLALAAVDNLCPQVYVERSVDEQAYRSAWLAGDALVEVGVDTLQRRDAWKARLERVTGWLAQLLGAGALTPVERAAAGRVLGRLGDPRDLEAMVFVPGGPFLMGSDDKDKDARPNERPQHTVEVADFCIGKYPVTNEQYARFVQAGGYDDQRYWTRAGWAWRTGTYVSKAPDYIQKVIAVRTPDKRDRPLLGADPTWNLSNHPVVGICWFEALAYTRWLAEVTGQPYRLPTEAEWEKAARGTDARIYPWGDEWDVSRANTRDIPLGRTTAVGAFPTGSSPYGAMDISGNVDEWCSSVGYGKADYPYRSDDGREDLERDTVRARRSGSWGSPRLGRCAYRGDTYPDNFFYGSVGFRVAISGPPPPDP